ncbi:hypothetical protein PHMEG_00040227 [Phytophthora megakarya]|uniref:Chromo domain-containing protein n=1 Tax=Phytophthora megakarya TaxID=4795 RepID=A0A225UDY5_9STRA|nr:hypothetical protein PHMEG_00040227 [Phytophthora megakarya]
MSEVFQTFAELIQARSRSTLSYRPQANGQQERSVKTVMQSVKVYAVNEFCDRPKARLVRDVADEARLDFDEELLPEDSWMPDEVAGEFEVEVILDDRTPMSTSTDRPVREFEVKWVGYESTTWEPSSNLSSGGLLYDYLRNKKGAQRLQMVQVVDED